MNKIATLVLLGIIGFALGFLVFQYAGSPDHCDTREEQIRANTTFNGSISCYPPGRLEVDQSEKVEENTDLECVCIRSFNGRKKILSLTKSL